MNKKNTVKKTAALILGIALTMGCTGCNFITTDSQKDLQQVVATVNISEKLKADEKYGNVANDLASIIEDSNLSTDVVKRDLIAYFLSTGYTYVQSYGYTYEDTFNMLMDNLVSQKIVTQYALAYYLANGISAEACMTYVNEEVEKAEGAAKNHPEMFMYEYFIMNGAKDEAEGKDIYNSAVYTLKKSLNSSLDSLEESYITASEEEHNHDEARTTPTGIATEKEDYYPKTEAGDLDYDVYTGRNAWTSCGKYEKIDGSITSSRQAAYNSFLANLQNYGLVGKSENTKDITKLDYYYLELSSTLASSLMNMYFEDLQDLALKALDDQDGKYVSDKYEEMKATQEAVYKKDPSAFATAIDAMSDTSFVLSGLEGYGFVYNILLPFSTSQNQAYSAMKKKGLTSAELYEERAKILEKIKGEDIRSDWYSAHDHANYAYQVEDEWYFFEDNFGANKDRYEELTHYAGMYPFNGTVTSESEHEGHEEYEFKANKLNVDEFVVEMNEYINKVVGKEVATATDLRETTYGKNYVDDKNEVNYHSFMRYTGKVDLTDTSAANVFNPESDQYKALSAVNELMFAYSTDTGCLNKYLGYSVSPYKTSYVAEFEYAAQYAIQNEDMGVGSYVVCATDFGWHIIYVSYVFDGGDVYEGYNHEDVVNEVEGSFSYMFYEYLKANTASTYTNEVQSDILNQYNNDSCVTLYKKAYKDLLEMDNNA